MPLVPQQSGVSCGSFSRVLWFDALANQRCFCYSDKSCVYIAVRDEWTELVCTSEAAPEELEEHSVVAHEVQTHRMNVFNPSFTLIPFY